MPKCPLCGGFFPFSDIGIHNILEGEDLEEFLKNERQEYSPEQIAVFKEAREIYRRSIESGQFKP
jgi:hypothetical protein